MINQGPLTDIIFELISKGFFKDTHSVIDMGDQDFKISIDYYNEKTKYFNIEKKKDLINVIKATKNYSKSISSSFFWKSIGIKKCDRLDILFKKRHSLESKNFKKINFDLNYEFNNNNYVNKYDLVTDFGNNEHPFNIAETFRTMHKLCKKNGILWTMQSVINGNGFYNFNTVFFEHLSAFNKYTTLYSFFVVKFKNSNDYIITFPNLNLINKINNNFLDSEISINYIFRKNSNEDFKIPYQTMSFEGKKDALFIMDINNGKSSKEETYILNSIRDLNYFLLLKEVFLRILRKIKLFNLN
jgi:hypothetical protein